MTAPKWRFFRAGGVDQVQLTTGAELVHIGDLDQKLWVALACPIRGLEFDKRTLELIDADSDGRVRASELIASTKWASSVLTDPNILVQARDVLPLSALNTKVDEGASLFATVKALLKSIGKEDETELRFDALTDAIERFTKEPHNGDGVVAARSTEAEELRAVIEDIVACLEEPSVDRSGEKGVDREQVTAFFKHVAAFVAWLDDGQADEVRPLGDESAAAYDAYEAVRAKIDDYFTRARVAAYDVRSLDAVNREQSEYLAIASQDLQISAEEFKHFPLARVTGDEPLNLETGINPAWSERMLAFREKAVAPLVGDVDALSGEAWRTIRASFAPRAAWVSKKPTDNVEKLGDARLRELNDPKHLEALTALLDEEDAAKPLADAIESVERLCHLNRDLLKLANNFVSFRDFYGRANPSIFQVGTLYIDRRSCDLCIYVNDAARHVTMAPHSNFYVLYCDLRNASGETRSIAAAVTDGDVDNLMVGRNGVFYDREGNDWDATVTRIVENPISIRQAFWSPYKKLLRLIEAQVSRRAQEAEERADARVTTAASSTDAAASGELPTAPPPAAEAPRKFDVGVVAALGVGVGGMVAALGIIMQAFFGLGIWMPIGFLALVLVVSTPSMIIAWLKLRTRNLGPLLDANGWAVGAMARVNTPLGKSLTAVATLPKGAERDLADPFAEKKRPWWLYATIGAVLVLTLLWYLGRVDALLPERFRSVSVLGEYAPSAMMEAHSAAESEPVSEPGDEEAGEE